MIESPAGTHPELRADPAQVGPDRPLEGEGAHRPLGAGQLDPRVPARHDVEGRLVVDRQRQPGRPEQRRAHPVDDPHRRLARHRHGQPGTRRRVEAGRERLLGRAAVRR